MRWIQQNGNLDDDAAWEEAGKLVRALEGLVGKGPHVWIRWEDDEAGGGYVIGDEDGEFARASDKGLIWAYVLDLIVGPGTMREAGLKHATQAASADLAGEKGDADASD
jgi:hypothetical protein